MAKTKQEIIEKIIQNIIITKPHLHFVYSEWCEIIDVAFREGYEEAINNYCRDK